MIIPGRTHSSRRYWSVVERHHPRAAGVVGIPTITSRGHGAARPCRRFVIASGFVIDEARKSEATIARGPKAQGRWFRTLSRSGERERELELEDVAPPGS
jgi:hypothetical protein